MSATLLASMVATGTLFACLSELESGNDDTKVGRVGEVSRYQIRPEIWREYTTDSLKRARYVSVSFFVAERIQFRRVTEFRATWNREPSVREWYILWNAPAQAYRGRTTRVVRERAERFANLVEASQKSLNAPRTTAVKTTQRR